MARINSPEDLDKLRSEIKQAQDKPLVIVGNGTCGEAQGSKAIVDAFKEKLAEKDLADKVDLRCSGCLGFCEIEPIVIVRKNSVAGGAPGILYNRVKPDDVEEILTATVEKGETVERLLYKDPATGNAIEYENELPFYKLQTRTLLSNNFELDPRSFEDYIRNGGYEALKKALFSLEPQDIIDEVTSSGLRGRGGAGFTTGMKWGFARKAADDQKYIICNADEGDPGAYMDRNILESNPHSVIEGMVIGAYAMGASKGYIYLRGEYPLALKHFKIAIEKAKEVGILGGNILGLGFSFDLEIYIGAGAFVCGEETALIASIEGKTGEPQQRPPYPAQEGLWGKPTNINNVETWANVSHIINKGADWYANIGTEESKGTKIFSLVGKINNIGLVEVPFGTPLRHVIYDIGGGIPNDRKFKAVQSGGPSGGCIPAQHLDTPIDYTDLTKLGSIMGSGGLIVMDEDTCMVDIARYFINFTMDESCGKCTSCREGTARMLEILEDICAGVAEESSLELLEDLAKYTIETSLCGLGQTCPNPVLTTLKYFKDEYLAHIRDKECPARVCKELIYYDIEANTCTGCTLCARKCPVNAITGEVKNPHKIDLDLCTKCGTCAAVCNFGAVNVKTGGQ